jgi:N-acetylglucosamine kinase-like BadF-type ATPase
MDQVAADLFTMVTTVLARLDLTNSDAECVFVGSILTEIEYVQSLLQERLGQQFPLLRIKTATVEPVFGALEIARSYLPQSNHQSF